MTRKKPAPEDRPAPTSPQEIAQRSAERGVPEEVLEGPPALETIELPPQESALEAERSLYTSTGPELSAGDVDADWQRAADVGEEAVGGTVATPDQDMVDEITDAVGVPRALDEEFRASSEILDARDRSRWESEDSESPDE